MITETSLTGLSHFKIIRKLTKLSVQKSLSYAIWKKPGSNRIMMTLANTTTSRDELSPEHEGAGFALAPFDPAAKKLFLPADHLFEFSNEESIEMTSGDLLDQICSLEDIMACLYPGPLDLENESAVPYAKLLEACIS
ncbi:MAG: hypothetical protein ACKO3B_06565, partial [Bacteroidota bacterium]